MFTAPMLHAVTEFQHGNYKPACRKNIGNICGTKHRNAYDYCQFF
jgi:hypothetical protein